MKMNGFELEQLGEQSLVLTFGMISRATHPNHQYLEQVWTMTMTRNPHFAEVGFQLEWLSQLVLDL